MGCRSVRVAGLFQLANKVFGLLTYGSFQVALNEYENVDAALVGTETVSALLVRCTIYENCYILSNPKPSNFSNLEERLVELYAVVLRFLARARSFFDKSYISELNKKGPCFRFH